MALLPDRISHSKLVFRAESTNHFLFLPTFSPRQALSFFNYTRPLEKSIPSLPGETREPDSKSRPRQDSMHPNDHRFTGTVRQMPHRSRFPRAVTGGGSVPNPPFSRG